MTEFERVDGTLVLPEDLTSSKAKPLYEALAGLRGTPVSIDASRVQQVGGACAQTLLFAKRIWDAEAVAYDITGPSTAFSESMAFLGLSETFNIPVESAECL